MWRADSDAGNDPDAGEDGKQKKKGWQRMRWLDSITDSMEMNLSKLREINSGRQWRTGKPGMLQSVVSQTAGHDLVTKQQQ